MASYKVYKAPKVSEKFNTPLQDQKEYYNSSLEWVSKNKEQVIAWVQQTGLGGTTLYVVPDNRILFLTTAWCELRNSAGAGSCQIILGGMTFLSTLDVNIAGQNSISHSYPMPLKIPSGTTISLTASANASATAGITGYLEILGI